MEDTDHFSQIRIGNRVIYAGVNGDAFSFGEKPPTVAHSSVTQAPKCRNALAAKGSTAGYPDASKASSKEGARATPSYITGSESFSPEEDCYVQKMLSASVSETNSLSSALENKLQFHQLKTSTRPSLLSASGFLLSPPSPAAVGLPPILPPPPAAHLPPPLPSRPPSAVPSPSSSVSSLLSFKNDDKSWTTPPPSPTQSPETTNAGDNNSTNSTSFRNFFFRSSGTIIVEAPSRDLLHSPPNPPLSPPPLPLPLSMASPFSSSTPLTAPKPVRMPNSRRSSESQASTEATSVTTLRVSPGPVPMFPTASSTSSQNDPEEDEETDLVDTYDGAAVSNVSFSSSLDEVPEGSLVATRDRENVFSKRRPSLSSEKSDANRQIIPPEFESIRKQSMTYADVISSVLLFYKLSKGSKKKIPYVQPKLEKASVCRKCDRQFGFRRFRYHCSRCKKAFCDTCIPIVRVDNVEQEDRASSMSRVCDACSEEIACETSRGAYRGLWTEFKALRDEARAHRGLDVTSSNINKTLESQSMLDVTPGLTSLCLKFLVDVHHQLEKQPRHKFLANYLHFENPGQSKLKSKTLRSKECQACGRQLRMLTEIHDCSLCEQTFCISCTYRTLQLYLPPGTDLKGDIRIDWIQFHVKNNEQDEEKPNEASETYRVCADCEDDVMRNFLIYDFNRKIPELEAEMFDLQRQIDHALTYDPHVHGMKRWASAHNLYHSNQHEFMATNVKLANRLYGRYMRAYDSLNHMEPQTPGQKTLHKHIKQAMYDFYLKRRNQLTSTLGSDDPWNNSCNEVP